MNPAGLIPTPDTIPVHWVWFEILLTLTFVIHLLFMNVLLGSGLFAFWEEWRGRGGEPSSASQLSHAMPTALAMTVTFGVAPLLFIQVLYGQFIYTSSVLMAVLWLSVVGLLILAYYGLYIYHFKYQKLGGGRRVVLGVAVLFISGRGLHLHQ